jgi:Cdc6-like AAA superfamily ATPase
VISKREPGTGQWFIDSSEFQGWLHGSGETLLCLGIPGAGKTMVMGIAIDHICRTLSNDSITVAYMYCNYKSQDNQSAINILASLLKQLVQSLPVPDILRSLHKKHFAQDTRPSLDEIFDVLRSVCNEYVRVHIVVDALDECSNRNGERNQLLTKLHKLRDETSICLLVTSRFIPEIEKEFKAARILEIRATDDDVRRYVAGQISRLPECIQNDFRLRILVQNKVSAAADGM